MRYFAYGSNMFNLQMNTRCPGAKYIENGVLKEFKFIINKDGVASVIPDVSESVYGVLWEITESHERTLDKYEGVKRGIYIKQVLRIKTSDDQKVAALVYIASSNAIGKPRKGYLEKIIQGALEHGLSRQYVQEIHGWN